MFAGEYRQTDRQTDRQNRLFDQKEIYKLHTIIILIDDQETATKTKFVANTFSPSNIGKIHTDYRSIN